MNGRISSFQSLGTVDGPGIRTVVFMQGCPLRCVCCHNPETWDVNGGSEISSDALLEKILRFKAYFGESGGVTVSGGEPLLQAEFLTELFLKLKRENISTALDTSGCVFDESTERLLSLTDLVLLDYKYTNPADYLKYTGCRMEKVDSFLWHLEKKKIRTWIRQVVISGLNDSNESFKLLSELKNRYSCIEKIELLPFRKLCIEKYTAAGTEFPLKDTPETEADFIEEIKAEFPEFS